MVGFEAARMESWQFHVNSPFNEFYLKVSYYTKPFLLGGASLITPLLTKCTSVHLKVKLWDESTGSYTVSVKALLIMA